MMTMVVVMMMVMVLHDGDCDDDADADHHHHCVIISIVKSVLVLFLLVCWFLRSSSAFPRLWLLCSAAFLASRGRPDPESNNNSSNNSRQMHQQRVE